MAVQIVAKSQAITREKAINFLQSLFLNRLLAITLDGADAQDHEAACVCTVSAVPRERLSLACFNPAPGCFLVLSQSHITAATRFTAAPVQSTRVWDLGGGAITLTET